MVKQDGRIALITGANRGIGRRIAKDLAQSGLRVWIGSRNLAAATPVVEAIREAGGVAESICLDVTKAEDISAVAEKVASAGGLDILVNNAGVALNGFDPDVVEKTLAVNFYGTLHLTQALWAHLSEGGRVVNVSSGMANREGLTRRLRARFIEASTETRVVSLMEEFLTVVREGRHRKEGWPSSAYRVSKLGLNALTLVWGTQLTEDSRKILCNAACPGWVRTDMGGRFADRTVAEGAETPVWLALLPKDGPQGGYFRDKQAIAW